MDTNHDQEQAAAQRYRDPHGQAPPTFWSVSDLARRFGVSRSAVANWIERYPPADETHPFPRPDILLDGRPGWKPERLAEIQAWRDGLPGSGSGGGQPAHRRNRTQP